MTAELVSARPRASSSLPTAIVSARANGRGVTRASTPARSQASSRTHPYAYTPAIRSSLITPHPPGSASSELHGGGLITSNTRNRTNPTSAPVTDTGTNASVTSIPSTSSITTGPGSMWPKCVSEAVAARAPTRNTTTIAANSTAGRPIARTAAKTTRPASDPNVPGAKGT